MVKEMPASEEFGPAVQLHEVTASGIDRHWDEDILNAHRLRVRSADTRGDSVFDQECNFPFWYRGRRYSACTPDGEEGLAPWCSLQTNAEGNHSAGMWGFCQQPARELAQDFRFSGANTCTDQVAHVCTAQVSAHWNKRLAAAFVLCAVHPQRPTCLHCSRLSGSQANYGAVEVDWAAGRVLLQVWTPHEEVPLALQHSIALQQGQQAAQCLEIPP